jgi:hypothetical protein
MIRRDSGRHLEMIPLGRFLPYDLMTARSLEYFEVSRDESSAIDANGSNTAETLLENGDRGSDLEPNVPS